MFIYRIKLIRAVFAGKGDFGENENWKVMWEE